MLLGFVSELRSGPDLRTLEQRAFSGCGDEAENSVPSPPPPTRAVRQRQAHSRPRIVICQVERTQVPWRTLKLAKPVQRQLFYSFYKKL